MTADLLVECVRVGAYSDKGLGALLVNVLQAVSIRVHHQTGVVIEECTPAVVTQLVDWKKH